MNRKEFKELLLEWRENFINERSINTMSVSGKEMTNIQKDFVNKVPFDLHLYAIGDFTVNDENAKYGVPISYELIKAMSSSSHVIAENKKKSIVLKKEGLNDLISVLESLLQKTKFDYDDIEGRTVDNSKNSNSIKKNLLNLKEALNKLKSSDSGILLYFPRMTSMSGNMADGSINNIGNIKDPAVWKNSLFWELKHDVFHYIEEVLRIINSSNFNRLENIHKSNDRIRKIINNFDIPDQNLRAEDPSIVFGSSLGDGDNFATVATYIRTLDKDDDISIMLFLSKCQSVARKISPDRFNPEDYILKEEEKETLKEFFHLVHACYEDAEEFLKDKILIQRAHG